MHRRDFNFTLASTLASLPPVAAAQPRALDAAVRGAVESIMREHAVPGMAVGLTVAGRRSLFNFGMASKESQRPVGDRTLFELGSISKTFTATLAAWARDQGALSLEDRASKYLPALAGSSFDAIRLRDLATYTAGGLPLQAPDELREGASMLAWYRKWQPPYPPGTHRLYSNPSIGLFGYLAARSLGQPFDALAEGKLFPALGLNSTWLRVPPRAMNDYAFGTAKDGKAVRVGPGLWDSEAYGVKTTAADMLRFLEANMDSSGLVSSLQRALAFTRTGFYRVGDMVQGLGWEMYPLPTNLDRLLAGNSDDMAYRAHAVARFATPQPPRDDVWVNKTGSTNGFGAYAAFLPAQRLGIVLLANRNYPIAARVTAAWQILQAVGSSHPPLHGRGGGAR